MNLTSKQRASLRSLANTLDTTLQIGKEGLTEGVIKTIEYYLEANELMKIRVLETAFSSAAEMCRMVCEAVGASPVQVIGSRFVIFRRSSKPENRSIEL